MRCLLMQIAKEGVNVGIRMKELAWHTRRYTASTSHITMDENTRRVLHMKSNEFAAR
jgi:hypothetical protein